MSDSGAMEKNTYTFIHVPDKMFETFQDKEVNSFLMKWSMAGNIQVQHYSFNQPFQMHRKEEFVEMFFADPVVFNSLIYATKPIGRPAVSVQCQQIPCTILSMEFFDRLLEPDQQIVRHDQNTLVQCFREDVAEFAVEDNLRNVILNKESEFYRLFSESDRKQFLWNIFAHLCLGGEWCQYEFTIEPYLNLTKRLYKELISVERVVCGDTSELVIRSIVLKVETFDHTKPLVPTNQRNVQNFFYLIIDPFKRSVTTFCHSFGGLLCLSS